MNELQTTKRNTLYKNTSHFILERGTQFVISLRDRWKDTCSARRLLAPYLLPGARGCQRLHPLASFIVRDDLTPLISSVSLARLDSDWTVSKSDHVVLISRGLLLVTHLIDRPTPARCHPPVYLSQRDSCSKHTGSPGTNPKSMSTVII